VDSRWHHTGRELSQQCLEASDILSELNLHLVPRPGGHTVQAQRLEQMDPRALLPEHDAEARLLALLETDAEPRHIDELFRASGLSVAAVSGSLVMLELKGLARLLGPMTYAHPR
jgi:predicted Rossmann fold nucleotide-binding protein DprA/Smf involved in DNA uptake